MTEAAPSRRVQTTLFGAFFALALACAWALWWDLFAAGAPHRFVVAVVGFAPAALILGAAVVAGVRGRGLVGLVALCAVTALVTCVAWHPRKRFTQDLLSLRNGMTVDEVERVMAGHIRGAGAKWAVPDGPPPLVRGAGEALTPEDLDAERRAADAYAAYRAPDYGDASERAVFTGTMVYHWNETDWEYDADLGLVRFEDGRVADVEFLPD